MFRSLQRVLRASPPQRSFFGMKGIFTSLKDQFYQAQEAGPARHNPHTMEMTETELFDEDAHELQAMVTNNPFDLEIMMGDVNTIRNFGTPDNPVLMFSANVGWRYVMCSGLNDEDEGSSHVGIWFILREGPIHRCPACGQCFKLLNLKDEISKENDYYLEHFMPILEEEMGDDDDWTQRWTFHNFAEPYPTIHPHQNTHYAYILVNPDDHDRILTDPAYRLQKLHEGHEKLHDLHQALIDVEERVLWQRGGYYPKLEYTPGDYSDLVTAEIAIRKLDRIFHKVSTFHKRSVLDPENHERREARMKERSAERTEKGYSIYLNTNELEQQFMDYFETDYDAEDELLGEQRDYEELVASGKFDFKNYDFLEEGLSNPTAAIFGTFERKIFKFKHRKWNNDPSSHFIRENRMIRRYLERIQKRSEEVEVNADDINHIVKNEDGLTGLERAQPYRDYVMDEAIQQYKDYYESDPEDLADFEYISPEEKAKFAQVYKDFSRPMGERKFVQTIPKREYDSSKGFLTNITEHVADLRQRLMPEVAKAAEGEAAQYYGLHTEGKDYKFAEGTAEYEAIEGLEEVFSERIEKLNEMNDPSKLK